MSEDLSPQELIAQLLRQRQLAQAQQEADRFGPLSAISQMANNPGVAQAAMLADKNQQARFKPQSLREGYMLPETGQFVPNELYTSERRDTRQAAKDKQAQDLSWQREREGDRAEARAREQAAAERYRDQMVALRQQGLAMQGALASSRAAEADARRSAAEERAILKQAKELEDRTNKFTTALNKDGLPELSTTLKTIQARLDQYPPGRLPGFGRLAGAVPDVLASTEAQQVRADFQKGANTILKSRSGAAVTLSEQTRVVLQELAMGKFRDEATMRQAWDRVMTEMGAKVKNQMAGVPPEVLDTYSARGGLDFSPLTSYQTKFPIQPQTAARIPVPQQRQPQIQPPPGLNLPPGATYIGPAP